MTGHPPVRGYGGLDGPPGQLVTEPEIVPVDGQEPGRRPARRGCRPRRRRLCPTSTGSTRKPSREAISSAGGRGSSRRAARDSTASRAEAGISSPLAPSTSTRKNGLPPVSRWSSSGQVRRALGQASYAGGGERRQVDASRPALAGQLAERHPQGVGGREGVVAERDHEQDRQVAEPAAEEAEQVEGRVVGPLHVLDDEHDERRGASSSQRRAASKTSLAGEAGAHRVEQVPTDRPRDVAQGCERARCEQAVAGTPDPAGVASAPPAASTRSASRRAPIGSRSRPTAPVTSGQLTTINVAITVQGTEDQLFALRERSRRPEAHLRPRQPVDHAERQRRRAPGAPCTRRRTRAGCSPATSCRCRSPGGSSASRAAVGGRRPRRAPRVRRPARTPAATGPVRRSRALRARHQNN